MSNQKARPVPAAVLAEAFLLWRRPDVLPVALHEKVTVTVAPVPTQGPKPKAAVQLSCVIVGVAVPTVQSIGAAVVESAHSIDLVPVLHKIDTPTLTNPAEYLIDVNTGLMLLVTVVMQFTPVDPDSYWQSSASSLTKAPVQVPLRLLQSVEPEQDTEAIPLMVVDALVGRVSQLELTVPQLVPTISTGMNNASGTSAKSHIGCG